MALNRSKMGILSETNYQFGHDKARTKHGIVFSMCVLLLREEGLS
mgnify:CR=1 FL=1